MKAAWNTSTLPAALDSPTVTVLYTERTPQGPARVAKVINRKPSERTLALDSALYTDDLQGLRLERPHRASMPRRIQQRRERAATRAYAAGTILCFAAIGLMLAWRG